ncbi:hypothetical protein Ahy_A01g002821 [Arachis hypogaea]|uniref:Uncharacterized protein n=1 Tax=Arachis hypogaea TaxID=3818 RepID=A0A445ERZ4_ARAHY|nr:hypothetical protein Ahy_A01g002821 [Arachis hypogaea]
MGRLRLMPKTFALRAVQRQAAASRSTRPLRREQQGVTGGCPKVTFNKPLRTLAHTPSLSASRGHDPPPEGLGFGLGLGLLLHLFPHPETSAKKRTLIMRKRAMEELALLEAISHTRVFGL